MNCMVNGCNAGDRVWSIWEDCGETPPPVSICYNHRPDDLPADKFVLWAEWAYEDEKLLGFIFKLSRKLLGTSITASWIRAYRRIVR